MWFCNILWWPPHVIMLPLGHPLALRFSKPQPDFIQIQILNPLSVVSISRSNYFGNRCSWTYDVHNFSDGTLSGFAFPSHLINFSLQISLFRRVYDYSRVRIDLFRCASISSKLNLSLLWQRKIQRQRQSHVIALASLSAALKRPAVRHLAQQPVPAYWYGNKGKWRKSLQSSSSFISHHSKLCLRVVTLFRYHLNI